MRSAGVGGPLRRASCSAATRMTWAKVEDGMGEGRRRMEHLLEVDVLRWMSISLYLTENEEWVTSSVGDSLPDTVSIS
jgi:hypothetical protein